MLWPLASSGRDKSPARPVVSAPANRRWARSRSGIVEQAVAKRLVGRPTLGGIAARPKFSGEVDANIDQRRPGRVELGVEMLESRRHLAGFERGDLVLVRSSAASPGGRGRPLVRVGSPGGFARGRSVFSIGVWSGQTPASPVAEIARAAAGEPWP